MAALCTLLCSWGVPTRPASAAEDPLAALAQHVRAGEGAAALAAAESLPTRLREGHDARYLRARLLEEAGKPRQALAALPPEAGLPGRVARDVAQRRVQLQAQLGDCGAATPGARALAEDGALAREARAAMHALLARCALDAGEADSAVTGYVAALELARQDGTRAALELALVEARLRAGARDAALDGLRALRIEHPDRPEADIAEARLKALGASAALTHDERTALAERWLALRQPARALEVIDAGTPASGKQASDKRALAAYLHLRGMALYGQRTRYAEAASVLGRAARLAGEREAFDAFHAARAWARADRDHRAVRALRAFVKRYPASRFVARAQYTAAWLELRHGMPGGRRNMQRFIDGKHADGAAELVRQGIFLLAMDARDRRSFARAQALFERYATLGRDAMVRARGLYWAGRAAAGAGHSERARGLLRQARKVEPLHWYALLAGQRLQELGEEPGPPYAQAQADAATATAATDKSPRVPLSPTLPPAAAFYARLGLLADARDALAAEHTYVKEHAPAGRADEALALAYQLVGNPSAARRLVARRHGALLDAPPTDASRWAWELAYARPYRNAIDAHGQAVDGALLYAVMRKESAFDPSVVSSADAIGLMQLLPATASKVAAGLGIEYARERLLEPEYNIRLGARLLSQLIDRFEGQVPLAIAAYNAGAHRVEPWLARETRKGKGKRKGRVDLDLFVERIPIDQTRNYVRRVITNWARYRYLSGAEDPSWAALPTTLSALTSSARRR